MLITTTESVFGREIEEYKGLVTASSVQTKSFVSDFGAGLKSLVGGKLSKYEKMCMVAQEAAINMIKEQAKAAGANAIVGVRYATPNTTQAGSAEIVAYGTAVVLK